MKKIISATLISTLAFPLAIPSHNEALEDNQPSNDSVKIVTVEEIKDSLNTVPLELKGTASTLTDNQDSLTLESDGTDLLIPKNPNEDVKLEFQENSEFAVKLPFSESLEQAEILDDGTVVYGGQSSLATSIIPNQSAVQIINTISSKEAPTQYEYEIDLPEGGSLAQDSNGSINIYNGDQELISVVGSPWAYDANGKSVPTKYSISGNKIIQIVEHQQEDVAYPVVSDPIFISAWAHRCLLGIGLNGPTIARIASSGSPAALIAAGGYAALRCVLGR